MEIKKTKRSCLSCNHLNRDALTGKINGHPNEFCMALIIKPKACAIWDFSKDWCSKYSPEKIKENTTNDFL